MATLKSESFGKAMIWLLLGNALRDSLSKTKPFMDASCHISVPLREEKHKFGLYCSYF